MKETKRYSFLVLIFFSLIFSCSDQVEEQKDKVLIDLGAVSSLSLSKIASSVEYVFLETTSNVFLGEVSKVEWFQSEYYVFDRRFSNELFVFSEDGSFRRKIGVVGDGPNEYGEANDFLILKDKQQVVFLDNTDGYVSLVFYTTGGDFVKKQQSELFADLFEFISPDLYVFYTSNQCNDEFCAPYFTTNLDLKVLDKSIPIVEVYEEFWMEPLRPMSLRNGVVMLTNYGSRLIHKVDSSGRFRVQHEIDFLSSNADDAYEKSSYVSIEELIRDFSERRFAFQMEELVTFDSSFFFSFQYGSKFVNAFVDQRSGKRYVFEALENDLDQVPLKFTVKGKTEDELVLHINPEEFELIYSQLVERRKEIPSQVEVINSRLSSETNPVLVRIKLLEE